jgi:hypothetical protein
MNISGVEPAERRGYWVTWGLAALGLTAALAAPLALKADSVSAEQNGAKAEPVAAAVVAGAIVAEDTASKQQVAYSIKVIKRSSDRLKLKGKVLTRDDHKALIGLVKASFPSADVTDRIKISDAPQQDSKPSGVGGISFALKILKFLENGEVRIDERGVDLLGRTESNAAYAEVLGFIDAPPTGVVVRQAQIKAPENALSWRAEVGQGRVRLTGAVPDSDGKKKLEASVQKLFSGLEIVNDTYIAQGAPESWLNAAMHSLHVLRLLDTGFVQLADHTIRLDGHASDELKLGKIDILADQYPTGFSFQSKVSAPTQASMMVNPWGVGVLKPLSSPMEQGTPTLAGEATAATAQ